MGRGGSAAHWGSRQVPGCQGLVPGSDASRQETMGQDWEHTLLGVGTTTLPASRAQWTGGRIQEGGVPASCSVPSAPSSDSTGPVSKGEMSPSLSYPKVPSTHLNTNVFNQ